MARHRRRSVSPVHPHAALVYPQGSVRVDGDSAHGRSYIAEFGRFRDGGSHLNYALCHDRYRRTPHGWRFAERLYEIRYVDTTPSPARLRSRMRGRARSPAGDRRPTHQRKQSNVTVTHSYGGW